MVSSTSVKVLVTACHSEEPFDKLRIDSATKNLVFGKQGIFYARNEILRLRYAPAQNDNESSVNSGLTEQQCIPEVLV